ncbi:MAG: DUF169 domain-containing protein [Bacteroidales bacterium]|nr:DUF169 domain-containing protein [Bacteroidales bacterium]
MSFLNQIQNLLGEKQTSIKINGVHFKDYNSPKKPIRFCEAVVSSLQSPLIIRKDDIDCLGAQRSFGFNRDDKKLTAQISEETNIPIRFILNALNEIPVINHPVKNIILGSSEKPDVTIAFLKPDKITQLTLLYAAYFEEKPLITPYFFMSVCGNIFAQTYNTGKISISFGCPESRKFGGILEDEVIVGIPNLLLNY